MGSGFGAQGFLHLGNHLIDGKTGRLHARRELLERRQKLGHDGLPGVHQVDTVNHPVPVGVGGDVRPLERVRAQVKHLGKAQKDERFRPYLNGTRHALLCKDEFPVVVSHGHQVAVVGKIYKARPGAFFFFAGKVRQTVVAVDMHLELFVANLVALFEFSNDQKT